MQDIQQLFGVFSGFIEQGNILRVPDMRGCTGSVSNHGTTVAAGSGTLIPIVFMLGSHQRGIKGQFAIVVVRIAVEIAGMGSLESGARFPRPNSLTLPKRYRHPAPGAEAWLRSLYDW